MESLDLLRDVNFEWSEHAKGVWEDHISSDSKVHRQLCQEISTDFEEMVRSLEPMSPLGRVVIGGDGPGKVHFLSDIRRAVNKVSGCFVLVDLAGVNHFWDAVLLGMLGSLKQSCGEDSDQKSEVLDHLIHSLGMDGDLPSKITPKNILKRLRKKYSWEVSKYYDVALAFLLLSAGNENDKNVGEAWLQGMKIGEEEKKVYGFRQLIGNPKSIIEGLSWLMSLRAPVLLAIDELDVIAGELEALSGVPENFGVEAEKVRDIFRGAAEGILSLRENTFRTMTVVTCLPRSWERVGRSSERKHGDRFKSPLNLGALVDDTRLERVIGARVSSEYDMNGLRPPFPLWPAQPRGESRHESMLSWKELKPTGDNPRQCGPAGMVVFDEGDDDDEVVETEPLGPMEELNARFADLKKRARVRGVLTRPKDRNNFSRLIQSSLRYLIMENPLPDHLDASVEINLSGDLRYRSLDARLRLRNRADGDREKHFCIRGIRETGSWTLQARLRAALMESGIDREINFRHLLVMGGGPLSMDPEKDPRFLEFYGAGGSLGQFSSQEIRVLWALQVLEKEDLPGFDLWLATEKPVSAMPHFCLPLSWLREEHYG